MRFAYKLTEKDFQIREIVLLISTNNILVLKDCVVKNDFLCLNKHDPMIIISSIEITNFRSIVKLDKKLETNHLNIIVGQNDIGKSNFLKALNLFFNGETEIGNPLRFSDDFSKYARTANKKAEEVTIKIAFHIPERFKDNEQLIWTKIWRRDGLHQNEIKTKSGKKPEARGGALQ